MSPWVLFFLGMLCLAIASRFDLAVSSFFYPFSHNNAFAEWLYQYGNYPAMAVVIVLTIWGWLRPSGRRAISVFVLTYIIVSGFLINGIFKECWGRPRPVQTEEFGGPYPFRQFYEPEFICRQPKKSFSSGHAASGFIFLALVPIGIRTRKKFLVWLGLFLGLTLGGLLGWARLLQGGHYLTDIVASGLMVLLTASMLSRQLSSEA